MKKKKFINTIFRIFKVRESVDRAIMNQASLTVL